MKVALVYPSSYSFRRDYSWEVRWIYHGLGLLISATKEKGYDMDLIDMRRCVDWEDYTSRLKDYDVIGFSIMSVDKEMAQKAIHYAKIKCPNAKIIVGGTCPTIETEMWNTNSEVDYVLRSEGEISFPELLKKIENKEESPKIIQGVMPDVDKMPVIDRDLWEEEFPWGLRKWTGVAPFRTFLTSRACVYQCRFCQPTAEMMFGRGKSRQRSVNNVIAEMKAVKEKYGMNSFMIHDDQFVHNKEWITEFVSKYKENFEPMPFIMQARANHMKDDELVKNLSSIGLSYVIVGLESGSNKILKYLRKGTTREMNIEAVATMRKYGVKLFANIMWCTPEETYEDALETHSMLQIIQPDHYSPTEYAPIPGSYLYDECKEKNLILDESGNRYGGKNRIKGVDYERIRLLIQDSHKFLSR